jgi:hypothetical protein
MDAGGRVTHGAVTERQSEGSLNDRRNLLHPHPGPLPEGEGIGRGLRGLSVATLPALIA